MIIRDPAEFADIIAAQRRHAELTERADRAVDEAFRHAEEAAAITGRKPPPRPVNNYPVKEGM